MNIDTTITSITALQFSIICPVFNSRKWVLKSLDTILDQTFSSFELVVIDDGSSDDTSDFIAQYLLRKKPPFPWVVLNGAHGGPGAARNKGIHVAKGNWIAFFDSDDLWDPNKLEKMAQAISKTPEANFFCHHEELVKLNGQIVSLDYVYDYDENQPLPLQLYKRNLFSTSAVVCQRSILLEHGMFDESLMSAQDYELWLRLSPHLRVIFVQERVGFYVERQGNITTSKWGSRMSNELLIAWRYRKTVSAAVFALRILYIVSSYHKQALVRLFFSLFNKKI